MLKIYKCIFKLFFYNFLFNFLMRPRMESRAVPTLYRQSASTTPSFFSSGGNLTRVLPMLSKCSIPGSHSQSFFHL